MKYFSEAPQYFAEIEPDFLEILIQIDTFLAINA